MIRSYSYLSGWYVYYPVIYGIYGETMNKAKNEILMINLLLSKDLLDVINEMPTIASFQGGHHHAKDISGVIKLEAT